MGYGDPDLEFEMGGGYTLEINWSTYPSARVSIGGTTVARKDWVMTGWFFIRPRITRWALRSIRAHEQMQRKFAARRPPDV